MTKPRWAAQTENSLAQVLCRLAEGDEALPGICGTHLREARTALAHLADLGVLKPPVKP